MPPDPPNDSPATGGPTDEATPEGVLPHSPAQHVQISQWSLSVTFILISVGLLVIGYQARETFNIYAAAASLFFFSGVYGLLSEFSLRKAFSWAWEYVMRWPGAAVFFTYLAIHYLLYGFLLERILVATYGYTPLPGTGAVYLTSNTFDPPSLGAAVLTLMSTPSLNIWVPPYYGTVLVPYGLFMGLVIALLITANLKLLKEMSRVCSLRDRGKGYVLLPALGVVSGASCCLSLPLLLTLVTPAAGAIAFTAAASYSAYFLFPPATAIALCFLLRQTERLHASTSEG